MIAPKVYGAVLSNGKALAAQAQLAGAPSVLFDAVALVLAPQAAAALAQQAAAVDVVVQAHAHLKAIGHDAGAQALLDAAQVPPDGAVVPLRSMKQFLIRAATRHWGREPRLRPVA